MNIPTPQLIRLEYEYRNKVIADQNRFMLDWSGSTLPQRRPGLLESLRRIVHKSPEV